MPAEHVIQLVLGANTWSNWSRVELDSDYKTPADGWSVEALNATSTQLASLSVGQAVTVLVDGAVGLRGVLEQISTQRDRSGGTKVTLSGRDLSAPLVDCSPAPGSRTWSNLSLQAAAQKWLTELGVSAAVSAEAAATTPFARLVAQPGETYWQVLVRYAKRLGLHVWMSPAGVLDIGKPDYTSPPVGAVVQSDDNANVLESAVRTDLSGRFSRVTVIGTATPGGKSLFGNDSSRVSGVAVDAELVALGLNRPLTLDVGQLGSSSEAKDRAEYEVGRRAHDGLELSYVVQGTGPAPGVLWTPNTSVTVDDRLNNVAGPFWLAQRRILQDRRLGTRTALVLREPHTFLPAAA